MVSHPFETSGMIAACCVMFEDMFRTAIPLNASPSGPSSSVEFGALNADNGEVAECPQYGPLKYQS
jgi:hypothetical protein